MNQEQFWQSVLESLEVEISKANFATWIRYTSILSITESELVISVPNGFTKEWLQNKYNKIITKVIQSIRPEINKIQYVVGKNQTIPSKNTQNSQPNININRNRIVIVKKNPYTENGDKKRSNLYESNLNKRYSFDNFISGPNNDLARQACLTISRNPGQEYNPLFIYGGVGLGKTHLVQATGNQILTNFPNKRVLYLTSEKFLNEVINAIGNRKTGDLRRKYRDIDVLLIDDVQFLAGKFTASEELFNTFNALYENNKQIIISSDRLPKEMPDLEDRLRSRFEGGMMVDVQKPSLEIRTAILKRLCEIKNFTLSDDILDFISVNFDNNVRELQGALNTVIANFSLKGEQPNLEATRILLKNNIASKPKNNIHFKQVLKEVSVFFDIPVQDIINRCRKKEIVYPRQIVMYLLRKELNNSFPAIGEKLGGRDHTTVMHACEKINKEIKENSSTERDIRIITEKLYNNTI